MAEFDSIKQMPYSLEAEQAILGAIILDAEKINQIVFLKAEDFYLEQHQVMYTAMLEMFSVNKKIDMITLLDSLVKSGNYANQGDASKYLKLIAELAVLTSNITEHANIIKDKAILRQLIDASRKSADDAYSEHGEVRDILDAAEQRIFEISQNKYDVSFTTVRDAVLAYMRTLQTIKTDPESMIGVKAGFDVLDNYIVSMGKGDLIIVGARPGMGKTSFAMNIALNVAKRKPKKGEPLPEVAVFSLEMSAEQLVSRMLSSESLIAYSDIRRAKMTDEQWRVLAKASSSLSETNILIDDSSGITAMGMKAKLRRLKNLKLVIIDYLQLMQSDKKFDNNKVQEVADITRSLKLMAKDLQVPIILCSQLTRSSDKRENKRPMLSDLRESGAIEQDADMVWFLYRDEYYKVNSETADKDKEKNVNSDDKDNGAAICECIVAKNRHGATGKVNFVWQGHIFRFIAIDEQHENE